MDSFALKRIGKKSVRDYYCSFRKGLLTYEKATAEVQFGGREKIYHIIAVLGVTRYYYLRGIKGGQVEYKTT